MFIKIWVSLLYFRNGFYFTFIKFCKLQIMLLYILKWVIHIGCFEVLDWIYFHVHYYCDFIGIYGINLPYVMMNHLLIMACLCFNASVEEYSLYYSADGK
jgi:hypothetical protein